MKIRYTIIGRNGAFLPHLALLILASNILYFSGLDFQGNIFVALLKIALILLVIYTLIMLFHFVIDYITINNQKLEKKFLFFKRTITINIDTNLEYKNIVGVRVLVKKLHIISNNQNISLFDWYKIPINDIETLIRSMNDRHSTEK